MVPQVSSSRSLTADQQHRALESLDTGKAKGANEASQAPYPSRTTSLWGREGSMGTGSRKGIRSAWKREGLGALDLGKRGGCNSLRSHPPHLSDFLKESGEVRVRVKERRDTLRKSRPPLT